MASLGLWSDYVPRSVGAAAETVLAVRGDLRRLRLVFENSAVPMVMVDGQRRYVDANRPARLTFRLSLAEIRRYTVDDLSPPHLSARRDRAWARMLETGCVAGPCQVVGTDGSPLDIAYYALANVLPGLHLIAFAPADWPEDELAGVGDEPAGVDDGGYDAAASLTPREIDVLALAADGFSGPELAQHLVLSPATVNSHFKNIYVKLQVRSRAAAVAKAMRLGLIC